MELRAAGVGGAFRVADLPWAGPPTRSPTLRRSSPVNPCASDHDTPHGCARVAGSAGGGAARVRHLSPAARRGTRSHTVGRPAGPARGTAGRGRPRARLALEASGRCPRRVRATFRRRSSSFVGRERARRIHRAAAPTRTRLITLLGPGGVGKTRLAVEAARRLDGQLPRWRGVLRPHRGWSGERGRRSWRRRSASRDRTGRDEFERIAEVLRHDRCLLVFDNCEHVIDEAAALVGGARSADTEHVVVIATSRVRLAVEGEQLCVVPPLASDTDATRRRCRCSSIGARAVAPGFEVDDTNRELRVRQLCASRSTDCRWPSNWPRRGCSRCRSRRSATASTTRVSVLHGGSADGRPPSFGRSGDRLVVLDPRRGRQGDARGCIDLRVVVRRPSTSRRSSTPARRIRHRTAHALVECSLAHRSGGDFALLDVVRRFASEHRRRRFDLVSTQTWRHAERMLVRARGHDLRSAADRVGRRSRSTSSSRRFIDFRQATDTAVDGGRCRHRACGSSCALRDVGMNAMRPEPMRWGERVAELGDTVDHPLTADGYAVARDGGVEARATSPRCVVCSNGAEAAVDRIGLGDRFEVVGTHGRAKTWRSGGSQSAVDQFPSYAASSTR